MSVELQTLRDLGALSELDVHFATALARLADERDGRVVLAVALVSQKVQAGHVCLDLPALCRETVLETAEGPREVEWPEPQAWLHALRASALAGGGDEITPLYLDASGRVYLRRYYEHERSLALSILERAGRADVQLDRGGLEGALDRLFARGSGSVGESGSAGGSESGSAGGSGSGSAGERGRARAMRNDGSRAGAQLDLFARAQPDGAQPKTAPASARALEDASGSGEFEADDQRLAAQRAAERAFCVISGGPGTGKTSTVVKILALIVEQARAQARSAEPPRILLLAPTGKAAARLSEAIKRAKGTLQATPEVRAAIPDEASTIHRALGTFGGHAQRFRHHRDAPLAADVVVVDEASMVDLALMARLFEAVPADARVILLGDKDQLASVEAGAVLGDICGAGLDHARAGPIAASIALLTRSYRYGPESGIGKLAQAINQAQPERVLELLRDPGVADVVLVEHAAGGALPEALWKAAVAGFRPLLAANSAVEKLRALDGFAVLCAHRRGPHGQLAINQRIEAALRAAGLAPAGADRYPGRPVIVTQNDYQARLFNGEVGVLLHDAQPAADGSGKRRLAAHFAAADGGVRAIAASRLPPHESAYALSVHKSQGSEFDEIAVVLPPDASPVLSRELLYTAVTRARKRVTIHGSAQIVTLCVQRTVRRASGLRDALWRAGQ